MNVDVDVGTSDIPDWLSEEFQRLLGTNRKITPADEVALVELNSYPDYIIQQAVDAAYAWLGRSDRKPIHSLARWLVGTAQRKWEAQQTRGSTVNSVADAPGKYAAWNISDPEEVSEIIGEASATEPPTPEEQVWNTVLQELALQVPKSTYDAWLRDAVVVSATVDEYKIGLPNSQAKDWLENRLAHTIKRVLASLLGYPVKISFHEL